MKKFLLAVCAVLTLSLSAASLFEKTAWQQLAVEGAEGTLTKAENGQWILNKTNKTGYLQARCAVRPAVVPGKCYRITVEFQSETPAVAGFVQVITLPQKRMPYPHSATVTAAGKPQGVSCFLQAKPGETSLIVNFLTKGTGKATISNAEIVEITPEEFQAATAAPAK